MSSRTKRILKLVENTKSYNEGRKNQAKIPQAEPDSGKNKPIETGTFFVDEHGLLIGPICENLSSIDSSNEILLNLSENEVFNAIQNINNLDLSQIIQRDDQNRDGNQEVQQTKYEGDTKLQKNTIEVDVAIENEIGTLRQDLLFNNEVQKDGQEGQKKNTDQKDSGEELKLLMIIDEGQIGGKTDTLNRETFYEVVVEEGGPEEQVKNTR